MLTPDNWPTFAASICKDPYEHSPKAMENFKRIFAKHIRVMKVPRGKFHSRNGVLALDFYGNDHDLIYKPAWERYLEKCEKLKRDPACGPMEALVALNLYRIAADKCKAIPIAMQAYNAVLRDGVAVGMFMPFKTSIVRAIRHLILNYGVKRDRIVCIWGGDDTLESKNRLTTVQIMEWLIEKAKGNKVPGKIMRTIERQLTESVEERELISNTADLNLDFGSQSRHQRQAEIDKFQSGGADYCFFTAAGSNSLSLHHCAKNDMGEEVTNKPRRGYHGLVFSPQDMVQIFGRLHRTIFSLSDTDQFCCVLKGTIEELVGVKVGRKLKAMSKLTNMKENWYDILEKGAAAESLKVKDDEVPDNDFSSVGADMLVKDDDDEEDED